MRAKNLKLIARTDEDLRIISAHLQDSIVSTENIAKLELMALAENKQFSILARK